MFTESCDFICCLSWLLESLLVLCILPGLLGDLSILLVEYNVILFRDHLFIYASHEFYFTSSLITEISPIRSNQGQASSIQPDISNLRPISGRRLHPDADAFPACEPPAHKRNHTHIHIRLIWVKQTCLGK